MHIGVGSILRSALSYVPFLHVHQPLGAVDHAVLWQLRAPRVALAALVGGMLAVAGASYQGVVPEPSVRPLPARRRRRRGARRDARDRLRVRAATGSTWTVPLAAFVGAIAAVVVTYALGRSVGAARHDGRARARRRHDGDLHGGGADLRPAAAHAAAAERLLVAPRRLLDGDLDDVAICAPYIAASSLVLVLHRRVLDVLSLGDDEASSLGIERRAGAAGDRHRGDARDGRGRVGERLIAFVGIIVPHTIRLLVSTSYRAVSRSRCLPGPASSS